MRSGQRPHVQIDEGSGSEDARDVDQEGVGEWRQQDNEGVGTDRGREWRSHDHNASAHNLPAWDPCPQLYSEEERGQPYVVGVHDVNASMQLRIQGSFGDDESDDSGRVDEFGMPRNPHFLDQGQNKSTRGCRHYQRGCKVVCGRCGDVCWCRHCHDEVHDDGYRDPKNAHQLDRFAVQQVVCGLCNTTQRVARMCEACGNVFGEYFCSVCNFFDDDVTKQVFHCVGCGLCRVGGRENFFHCAVCGCCYAIELMDNHRCIAGVMQHACPICLTDLFHSTSQVRMLRCGHTLHKKCLDQLLTRKTKMDIYTCPLCSKTLSDHSHTWHQYDLAVSQTEMPKEYANRMVSILCNDCGTKGKVKYHVYGHKCPNEQCGGYNTRRILDS